MIITFAIVIIILITIIITVCFPTELDCSTRQGPPRLLVKVDAPWRQPSTFQHLSVLFTTSWNWYIIPKHFYVFVSTLQHCLKLVTSTWVHLGTFWVLSSTYWCSRLCCCHRRPLADSQRSDTACQNISTAWEGAGLLYHRHRHHHRHCRHYHYCRHRQHHQRHHHCLSKY